MISQVNFDKVFLTQMIKQITFTAKAANQISRLAFSIRSVKELFKFEPDTNEEKVEALNQIAEMTDEMKAIEEEMKVVYTFFEVVKKERGFEVVGLDKFRRQFEDWDNNAIYKVLGSMVKE